MKKQLANNVNWGKVYEKSNWGDDPKGHLKSIIKYATQGLQELVKLTIDTTKIMISNINITIDKLIQI